MRQSNWRRAFASKWARRFVLAVGLMLFALPVLAEDDLLDLSLEDLMNVEVTSVSKKAESRIDAAAAITVITTEDIRRGGFTSIPEALRVVPGLKVMQIDANRWSISVRGFSQEFSNKLLVMIDGRTVYTPLFGGVYWDVQDYPLEDIDRIEVIRGPGGTVWGENAVNGVINVITKHSKDTQGLLASGYGGNQEWGATARWGGKIAEKTTFRGFVKGFQNDDQDFNHRTRADDGWESVRGGIRLDSTVGEQDRFRVSADYYKVLNENRGLFNGVSFNEAHFTARGGNILLGWGHDFGERASLQTQAYYDGTVRKGTSDETRHIADLDSVFTIAVHDAVSITSGVNYRFSTSHITSSATTSLDPNDEDQHLTSVFSQIQFDFGKWVTATMGTKLAYNSFSGFEYQPAGRIVLKPFEGHSIWAAVSRAVRTPTQIDRDVLINIPPINLRGDRALRSEELVSLEGGYRFFQFERITAEISLFYNLYEDLSSLNPVGPVDFAFSNGGEAEIFGLEAEINFLPVEWWRLSVGYSYLLITQDDVPTSPLSPGGLRGQDPKHTLTVRSFVDLPMNFELDTSVYYVDSLRTTVPSLRTDNVKQYVRLDLRLGYTPNDWLELALIGQNLTDPAHPEFRDVQNNESSQIPRSFLGRVTFRYR